MPRPAHARYVGRQLMVMILTVFVLALLLFVAACESLATDTAEETTSTDHSDITVIFGTWDGTYTPDAAWDEDGNVDDPPFELNIPVDMHMELHPWDADSAEYGTVSAAGLSPASVTSITREGAQFTLMVISEAENLNDLLGIFELTLEGDTLSGEDDSEPEVPSGWISSSGAVVLTRTAAWDPSAATDTTEEDTPGPAPGGDAGARDDDDADEGMDDDEPGDEMIPEEVPPPDLILGAGDNGGSSTIRVGDTVLVHFEYLPGTEIADIFCRSTSEAILLNSGGSHTGDPETHYYYVFNRTFRALAPGTADVITRSERADGTLYQHWRYTFVVEE